jgi:hypothetical protein
MSIWGNTEAWAGNRPHKILHSDGDRCNRCPKRGKLVRQEGGSRGGDMEMIESGTNQLLKVWRCVECGRIWFSRPGMLGFFAIQQVSKDEMRILK